MTNEADLELMVDLGDGNPRALTVLAQLYKDHGSLVGRCVCGKLRRLGIRGSAIWEWYKDRCGQNLQQFADQFTPAADDPD